MLTNSNYPQTAGAVGNSLRGLLPPTDPSMPPSEMGAVQSQIQDLEKCLHEVFANQEIIEQRLVPVSLPYPCGGLQGPDVKEQQKCQIQDAIADACSLLNSLAQRQRLTLQHLQV